MMASVFASRFGMLTALRIVPSSKRGANRLRDLDADAFLRFRSRGAEMRSENEVRRVAQRRINRQRFGLKNIQCRAGYMPVLQRFGERGFVDQARRARN